MALYLGFKVSTITLGDKTPDGIEGVEDMDGNLEQRLKRGLITKQLIWSTTTQPGMDHRMTNSKFLHERPSVIIAWWPVGVWNTVCEPQRTWGYGDLEVGVTMTYQLLSVHILSLRVRIRPQ